MTHRRTQPFLPSYRAHAYWWSRLQTLLICNRESPHPTRRLRSPVQQALSSHGVRTFVLEGRLHRHLQQDRCHSPIPRTSRTHTLLILYAAEEKRLKCMVGQNPCSGAGYWSREARFLCGCFVRGWVRSCFWSIPGLNLSDFLVIGPYRDRLALYRERDALIDCLWSRMQSLFH